MIVAGVRFSNLKNCWTRIRYQAKFLTWSSISQYFHLRIFY